MKSYLWVCLLAGLSCGASAKTLAAQEPPQLDIESQDLTAGRRVFTEVGPGLRAVRQGPDGRLYLLVSPQPGLLIFEPNFKPVMQIGAALSSLAGMQTRPAAIVFGEDFDVDRDGNIYVADRGANSLLVFSKDGTQIRSIPVAAPVAVAALPEGEVAVATVRGTHLVSVFDKNGRDVREFGDPESISDRDDLNRYLSTGLLATNGQGRLFYAFPFMPEPTVREYDRFGFAGAEIQYTSIDILQVAQAARKEIQRQERRHEPPYFKRNLTAVTVDRGTGEVWIALHDKLLHFDKDGNRLATYILYTPEGGRLETTSVLVDSYHILAGNEALGIYEFARPDKPEKNKTERENADRSAAKKTSP